MMKPRASLPAAWRQARIATLLWLWLIPVTLLSPDGRFHPDVPALFAPTLTLLVLVAAAAWELWAMSRPDSKTTIVFFGRQSDAAEYVRLLSVAGVAWLVSSLGYPTLFRVIEATDGFLAPHQRWPAWLLINGLFTLFWVLLVLVSDFTVVDTVKKTVTHVCWWPRELQYDEVMGIGTIREVNRKTKGERLYLALFPVRGQPWRLLHFWAMPPHQMVDEMTRLTGLPTTSSSATPAGSTPQSR